MEYNYNITFFTIESRLQALSCQLINLGEILTKDKNEIGTFSLNKIITNIEKGYCSLALIFKIICAQSVIEKICDEIIIKIEDQLYLNGFLHHDTTQYFPTLMEIIK